MIKELIRNYSSFACGCAAMAGFIGFRLQQNWIVLAGGIWLIGGVLLGLMYIYLERNK